MLLVSLMQILTKKYTLFTHKEKQMTGKVKLDSNTYTIEPSMISGRVVVVVNGVLVSGGYKSRASARKAITRFRRQDAGVPGALHR
jgi:hypothetical protein